VSRAVLLATAPCSICSRSSSSAREQTTARGERADIRRRRHRRVPGRPPEPCCPRPALGAADRCRRAAQLSGLLLERARLLAAIGLLVCLHLASGARQSRSVRALGAAAIPPLAV
jgi:hypothetical protein